MRYCQPDFFWIFRRIYGCVYFYLAGDIWNFHFIQPFMILYAESISCGIVRLLLDSVSSASAIDSLIPTPISLESRLTNSPRFSGSSDLFLLVKNPNLVSPDA